MNFLKKAAREEDTSDESGQLEEQYMKMFPKIGRDFVHKDDLENIVRQMMVIIDPLGLNPVDATDDSEARSRAEVYKSFLDDGTKGNEVYKDLIDLEED